MSWRSVFVSNPARLSLKNKHLVIKQGEETHIPLEDISVIVMETDQATITSKLLDELARRGVLLFSCDPRHLPSGLFLPFQQHSRFLKILKMQLELTMPFMKNCWRIVVAQKIKNQALCLEILGKNGADELRRMALEVKSGDSTNRESAAAKLYFDIYMPHTSRQEDNTVNAALNYGYSIMRGAVARSLVAYGFLPAVGIHHRNELNSFNLADDFMELFRPLVDLWVAQNIREGDEFRKEDRAGLLSLLHADTLIFMERHAALRAIDIMISSFSHACSYGRAELLKLPELTPISEHVWK